MAVFRQPRWPKPGAPLAVAAPSGAVDAKDLAAGLKVLAALAPGSALEVDDQVRATQGYLAGSDMERARHLEGLLSDQSLGAVICARGGYGASRLLGLIDIDQCAAHGACLIGCSDITALLNPLATAGLITVHGPVVTQLTRLDQTSLDDLAGLLAGRLPWPLRLEGEGLVGGTSFGPLLGGNLTLLCHLLGTPYFPDLHGAILFIEEINEEPYRLDRLLTQLELAGVFSQVAGVAVGSLSAEDHDPLELRAVVQERLSLAGCPVVMGLAFGHGSRNRPLLVGAPAEIDGARGTLSVGLDLD